MTSPNGASTDGAYVVGTEFGSDLTEATAKNLMKGDVLYSWQGAQNGFRTEVASTADMNREVVRLDNRIDEVLIGTQRAQLATFSLSGTWNKPAGVYKVVVDIISGATGGDCAAGGAQGGWGGGWERIVIYGAALEAMPSTVAVTVGGGGAGDTTLGSTPAPGGASSFGSYGSSDGATWANYGTGARTYRMRGGKGGTYGNVGGQGSDGPFDAGGLGGAGNSNGGTGFSLELGEIGMGSAGGGGGGAIGGFSAPGNGAHGGWPGAPGGGGGESGGIAAHGNGGNGAGGAVYVTSYREDTAGLPPTRPTDVVVSAITSTTATVTWTASTDDIAVDRYEIMLGGEVVGETLGITFNLTDLTPSTAYSLTVRAVDLGRNVSDPSTPSVSFSTTA